MDLGAAAFWVFLAAIIVAGIWRKKHSEALRHETARLLIEKNQNFDGAQLKELLNPTPPPVPEWLVPRHKPGEGYRVLRIFGTICMFVAFGLAIAGIWRGMILGLHEEAVMGIAMAVPIVAMIGIGLFVASRYVTQPSDESRNK